MTEYINKAELINYLEENILWTKRSWEDMTSVIDELPTIDIVHCSDCKHYGTEDDYDMCKLTRILHDDDWFCADGERKEVE